MKLILVRHGQSIWNQLNLFTGWEDVELSDLGIEEAKNLGKRLNKSGISIDIVYTSLLKRAIHTAYYVLNEMNLNWIPMIKDWRINERHYGALQGLNKSETATKFGDEQVQIWRRSFDVRPPVMDQNNDHAPQHQKMYKLASESRELPLHESLKDTKIRTLEFYDEVIKSSLKQKQNVLIAAHGNSLRSLIMKLEDLNEQEVVSLELQTGVAVVYTLDNSLKIIAKEII